MAMLKKRLKQLDTGIPGDMTPLIDCIFLLLIFLMIATEITKTENDQNLILPYSKMARKDKEPEDRIVINVWSNRMYGKGEPTCSDTWANGEAPQDSLIMIAGDVYNWGGLQEYLRRRAKTAPKEQSAAAGGMDIINLDVKIRGHRTCPYKLVQFAMVYCIDTHYWRISFGTYERDYIDAPSKKFGDTPDDNTLWNPPALRKLFN